MKTRLLWTLILLVGNAALYFGVVRPEVSTTPKRVQDFVAQDPATRPPIQLPPMIVSEPRVPATAGEPAGLSPVVQDTNAQDPPPLKR
jgi:hypothetical protein